MVRVRDLLKRFPAAEREVTAADHVSLEVGKGKFFSLLGPSGCGKTTTLRCIAGLERPDEGNIEVEEVEVFSSDKNLFVPPHQRDIGMVFQSYAIWPHMSVFENVAFPLKIGQKRKRGEIVHQVEKALALVHLEGLNNRPATNLSGGQQQRLALARAVVREPKLLLLDEPLSNLDAKLREEMRGELKRVQQILGLTTIYVTHDQTEALSMSDIVAVMNEGKIIQVDEPTRLYENPANRFVAEFIGAANLISGTLTSAEPEGEVSVIETPYGRLLCPIREGTRIGANVFVSIKPEDLQLSAHPAEGLSPGWVGKVDQVSFLGGLVDYRISFGGLSLHARVHPSVCFRRGDRVYLAFQPHRVSIIPVDNA